MPGDDGEGITTESGEELVAQIIPLRQRAKREARGLPEEPGARSEPEPDSEAPTERSVWDEPPAPARRHGGLDAMPMGEERLGAPHARKRWRESACRRTGEAVAGVGAIALVVGVLVFTLGAAHSRSEARAQRIRPAVGSAPTARTVTRQRIAASAPAPHLELAARGELRRRQIASHSTSAKIQLPLLRARARAEVRASAGRQRQTQGRLPLSVSASASILEAARSASASAGGEFGFER